MSEISIRPATLDDLGTIIDFSARLAAESEGIDLDREVLAAGIGSALEDSSRARYFLAETAGEVAGQLMITYEWSDWRNGMFIWIQSVYVRAENRRKGVFKALYDHVIELASSPGYCGVRLYVHDGNTSARETYLRLGMVEPGYTVLETPDELKHEDES
ncbi:MAG: GNAT family N-acetyltransferase [Planctomycetota bacterium]|nr:GNAT family N-acetyltransferase [Planctomycetota bacterium]MEC8935140.1 GNAT family N-acetyltransferase [Planctomycetota bacterium]|tara:strand:- start:580 stop:1056 length:477 start_codon:yes stop_codon:yes gene_type:complete